MSTCIEARTVIRGSLTPITILVEDGVVAEVHVGSKCPAGWCKLDLNRQGLVLLPGFVDLHVHLRGLEYSYKEDEASGTAAAAAGGYTGVVDMPNTYPKINTWDALRLKAEALASRSLVNYGVHLGVPQRNAEALLEHPVVMGLKIYPNDLYNAESVREAMDHAGRLGKPVVVHCEHPDLIREGCVPGRRWACRSVEAEHRCIGLVSRIAPGHTRIHITHATSPGLVFLAKRSGFTVDTCPHYFTLSSEDEARLGCLAKVNPPLRPKPTAEQMMSLLSKGILDAVVTDHAPHAPGEKMMEFDTCPAGIVGLETHSRIMLDLALRGLLGIGELVELMSQGPAAILGLRRYGCIGKGCLASYTVVDVRRGGVIGAERLHSKARYTPFQGYRYRGEIHATIVNGLPVYLEDELVLENRKPLPLGEWRCRLRRRLWVLGSGTRS